MAKKTTLNKTQRAELVRAVMNATPRKHTPESVLKRMAELVDADIADHAPELIAQVWADKECRPYLNAYSMGIGSVLGHMGFYMDMSPGGAHSQGIYQVATRSIDVSIPARYKLSQRTLGLMRDFKSEVEAEQTQLRAMRQKLEGAFAAIRTHEQFAETYPELAKYLPKVEQPRLLPVVVNLMEDLSKLGFPADQEEAVAA